MKKLLFFTGMLMMYLPGVGQVLQIDNPRCEYRENPLGVDAVQPVFSWELKSSRKNLLQSAYRILVADNAALLEKYEGNVWDSRKFLSPASIQVVYEGKTLEAAKRYYWRVMVWDNKGNAAWSEIAYWQMGLLDKKDWKEAGWIGYEAMPDSSVIVPFAHGKGKKSWGERKDVLPLLRKTFSVDKPVRQATAFICGLGQFEMSINGKKTGDHFLDPGWTQYARQALYVTFDVTKEMKPGKNAIGVMLGNGFYYIPGERYRKLTGAYGYPALIVRLLIEYNDGTTADIITDESWKTAPSPVVFSSIYGGEDYDATREQEGWNESRFRDDSWKQAVLVDGPPSLQSQMAEPLKEMELFKPVAVTQLGNGNWIYDLGQNFSGIPAISLTGKRGDTVRIIPAELINEEGSANQKGTGGPSFFSYVLKGGAQERFQPRFTYYGFRYLEVQGAAPADRDNPGGLPVVDNLVGIHTRNAARKVGTFNCSSELFNQIFNLIDWAIKSNTVSVFTDCPHREKLGWLEQTHLMGSSVQYNYDVAALFRKVISDMICAQTPEGLVPEIAPEYVQFEDPFRDSPEWGSACIILPWYNYKWYADLQSLRHAYPMMKKYIAYLENKAEGYILSHGLGDWYDIGPARPGVSQLTPLGVTATASFYYDLSIMIPVASLLGKTGDVDYYRDLAASVKKAFNDKYFDSRTKQYATGSQTANAMALYMQLVPDAERDAVVANLVKDIRSRNNALTAGDIGYRYVLRALEAAGRSDLIFDMNSRTDVPGYGYQLAHGATALTESWQAYPSVSNNHFMLGHLMEWFYAGLCGIKQSDDAVACNKIEFRPQPAGNISRASASFHSAYGLVRSSWKKKGKIFTLEVEIPPNTSATVYFPPNNKYPCPLALGSGCYSFTVQMNQ